MPKRIKPQRKQIQTIPGVDARIINEISAELRGMSMRVTNNQVGKSTLGDFLYALAVKCSTAYISTETKEPDAAQHILVLFDEAVEEIKAKRKEIEMALAYFTAVETAKTRLGDVKKGELVAIPMHWLFNRSQIGTTKVATPAKIIASNKQEVVVSLENMEGVTMSFSPDVMVKPYTPGDNLEHRAFGSGEDE